MKEKARQRTEEGHKVKGTASVKAQRQERGVCTWQHTEVVGEKSGKEGCVIRAFPVQIRNAVSIIRESVLSQLKTQALYRPGFGS